MLRKLLNLDKQLTIQMRFDAIQELTIIFIY